jgi:hypothetical protein
MTQNPLIGFAMSAILASRDSFFRMRVKSPTHAARPQFTKGAKVETITVASERIKSNRATVHPRLAIPMGRALTGSMELLKRLIQIDAVLIKLEHYFQQTTPVEQSLGVVLIPVDETVKKLISAREASLSLGVELSIFACTEARRAVAVNRDRDSRDCKYLSGLASSGGLHAYCGGLDATISRALIYASHADVVCFKSAQPDISEARRFAEEIRAICPEKQLAFGYSPRPDGPRWNEIDHAALESELRSLGFDYYFFTQFGSMVFPHFPPGNRWVMLDDALRMHPPMLEI